jgi:hypothetical protein
MLINFKKEGLEVISHAAHGLLAGKIANELHHHVRNDHWVDTLATIMGHDDEQLAPSAKNCISELGMPLDFVENSIPPKKSLAHAQAVYDKMMLKSSWAALLLSYHLEFLYAETVKGSKDIEEFLKNLRKNREELCTLHGTNPGEMGKVYQLMVFSDRLSLILCQDEVPAAGREVEINQSVNDEHYFVHRSADGSLTVRPWLFQKDYFKLQVDARYVKEIKFADEAAFERALSSSDIRLKSFVFKKTS